MTDACSMHRALACHMVFEHSLCALICCLFLPSALHTLQLGTHIRGKRKREELAGVLRKMAAKK